MTMSDNFTCGQYSLSFFFVLLPYLNFRICKQSPMHSLFFYPIEEQLFAQLSLKALINSPQKWLENTKIALFIVSEREETGRLFERCFFEALASFDKKDFELVRYLGIMRHDEDPDNFALRLREICTLLLQNNIVPFIISDNHTHGYAQFLAFQDTDKDVSVVWVDKTIDLLGNENTSHVGKILAHQPNFLVSFAHIAHQTHLLNSTIVENIEKCGGQLLSLGQIQKDHKAIEPIVRLADMLSFDLQALRSSDYAPFANTNPAGLSTELACQIAWYAGANEKLALVGLFHQFMSQTSTNISDPNLNATIFWYFLSGFSLRANDFDLTSRHHSKVFVPMKDSTLTLTFFRSNRTQRWWIEVPKPSNPAVCLYLPVSESAYLKALDGELPQIWITYTEHYLI